VVVWFIVLFFVSFMVLLMVWFVVWLVTVMLVSSLMLLFGSTIILMIWCSPVFCGVYVLFSSLCVVFL